MEGIIGANLVSQATPFAEFKVASNIGFLREDNVWVTQYDSLFIVMNNKGQVVTWQLTKGTSFGQIEHLSKLSHRALQQSQNIGTIYIDECCKLRNKVQSVFGKDVSLNLDLFHGVPFREWRSWAF